MALQHVLDTTADRIASGGTQSESRILTALSAAANVLCPGAARALVDWGGPEIVRLRAFGIVYRALLQEGSSIEVDLLESPDGTAAASLSCAA